MLASHLQDRLQQTIAMLIRRLHMPLGPLLGTPLAQIFRTVVLARRFAYDRGLLPSRRSALFTVSIGGLEAGGSGKTPVTSLILRAMLANGRFPGLLSRGYGRVSRGVIVRPRQSPADSATLGDEPAMLIDDGLDIPVAICNRRVKGLAPLLALGCDTLVLDDAFSHRALQRHVDIVVLRGEQPLGNGFLLPRGSLREPPSSLRRADVIWLHFRTNTIPDEPPLWLSHWCPGATWVLSRAVPTPPRDLHDQPVQLNQQRVIVAAGIAHPHDVTQSAIDLGAHVLHTAAFPDHHNYTSRDAVNLITAARQHRADAIVVTPKDRIKLKSLWPNDVPLWTLGTHVHILSGAHALARHLHLRPDSLMACDHPCDDDRAAEKR